MIPYGMFVQLCRYKALLLIRDRYELLPSKVLSGSLPEAFIDEYYHWYNYHAETIIFQPKKQPWSFSTTDTQWRLHKVGSCWQMLQGTNALLNMMSKSARVMAAILQPLEENAFIHNIFDSTTQRLRVLLPRLDLDFYVMAGDTQIYSRQYRGLILDPDQNIGTLIGFSSRLVLRKEHSAERLLLVPEGEVNYVKDSSRGHVSVTITKGTSKKVHSYSIDQTLQRVVAIGDLQCNLLLAYLHALTSSHMPDPLTHRTGTESALEILRSAAVLSFGPLTPDNIEMLFRIAKLSPARYFYPHYLKEMQSISWDPDLSSMSQDGLFSIYVNEIFDQARKQKVFYQNTDFAEPAEDQLNWLSSGKSWSATFLLHERDANLDSSEPRLFLQKRDAIRSAYVRTVDYGGRAFTSMHDTVYTARDLDPDSENGRRAFIAATMIAHDQPALPSPIHALKDSLLTLHFNNAIVKGSAVSLEPSELRYDSQWAESLSSILSDKWCKLHKLLADPPATLNAYDIMTWLSTMAFKKSANMNAILALGFFFKRPELARPLPPTFDELQLYHGYDFSQEEIFTIVRSHEKTINDVPNFSCPKNNEETGAQHAQRKHSSFIATRGKATKKLVMALEAQWPCQSPIMPDTTDITDYVRMSNLLDPIDGRFKNWFDNRNFKHYLGQISELLGSQQVSSVSVPVHSLQSPQKKHSLQDEYRFIGMQAVFDEDPAMLDDCE